MKVINKLERKSTATVKELVSDYREAYRTLLWEVFVINLQDRQGFDIAVDEMWANLKQQSGRYDFNGKPIPVTQTGYDGKQYAVYKSNEEQLSILKEAVGDHTESEVKQIASESRKQHLQREADRIARLDALMEPDNFQTDKLGDYRPEYVNGDIYQADYLEKEVKQLQEDIQRLQDKAPTQNILKLLDMKVAKYNQAMKRLSTMTEARLGA